MDWINLRYINTIYTKRTCWLNVTWEHSTQIVRMAADRMLVSAETF
jgi:hypothetical protein